MNRKIISVIVAVAAVMSTYSFKAHAEAVSSRYSGMDRYETAAKVCQDGWKDGATNAIIVNGENFPDALAAAPLAKKFDAPILLTSGNELSAYTSVEINRLGVKNVYLIGGRGVISQGIEDALKARDIKVTRLGGADRYETAIQIAGKLGKTKQVALINGNDFRDGMSIAPIAAMKGMAIIPVEKDSLPSSIEKYLKAYKKADQIYVIGGQDKIEDKVVQGLTNIKRIGGGNIYSSNVNVLEAFASELDTSTVYIASAKDFPDALSASAIASKSSSPVLFVDNSMGSETQRFLKTHIINNVKVLGGSGSIAYETEQIAKNLPLAVANTENINDTIWQNEKYTPRSTMIITASDGSKKEASIDWNLTKVNTTKPGIYTFTGKVQGTDKSVFTNLVVRPLPYNIADLEKTCKVKEKFPLPATIPAEMTDGTTCEVPVTWDYGTQQGNKPGIYVFYGKVDRYDKKVKLTLNTNPKPVDTILSIADFKREFRTVDEMNNFIKNSMPNKATVKMSDGSTKKLDITWDASSTLINEGNGKYKIKGSVDGYSSKVNYIMYVEAEGGRIPDPSEPGNPGDNGGTNPGDNPGDNGTIINAEAISVIQGHPYDLPTNVIDPATKKSVKVDSWSTKSINAAGVDDEDYDKCNVSVINFEGTINGSKNKVNITVNVKPEIISVYDPDTHITINRSDSVYKLPDTIKVNVANGNRPKKIKVKSWDKPYINLSTPQTYYIRGAIDPKYYRDPIMVTLRVQE